MPRLFVAIRPPLAIRAQLCAIMDGIADASWQSDDQLHLTLRYIGEVDARVAEDVALALGGVHAPPMLLEMAGVGMFDTRGRSNSVWAGVRPGEALAHLHRKIDRALVAVGLPPEGRAYHPHITLARLNAASGAVAPFIAQHMVLTSPPFVVDHFLLFESVLGRDGAHYDAVARYRLG